MSYISILFKKTLVYISIFTTVFRINAQAEWTKFTPDKNTFEILAPGELKYGEKNLLTDVGSMKVVTYMYQGQKDDPNFIYLINYVDYPEGTFHLDSVELIQDFFNISIQTNLNDLGAELIYKSEAPLGLFPCVIYRAKYNKGGAIIKSKLILVKDRFYALQVYTLAEKSLNLAMDRFLDSFKANIVD